MRIEEIDVEGWERVVHATSDNGLDCWVAIHDTTLGPALGGTRFWKYESDDAAKTDVLRLSEGMTLKNSLAGLDLGGGKAVINLANAEKTEALLQDYAKVLNTLEGKYITAEDVGCTVDDMVFLSNYTEHVSSVKGCGDPSFATAYGVVRGWQACAQFLRVQKRDQSWPTPPDRNFRSLKGVSVIIQGTGHVGLPLARMAHDLGMHLIVTDINSDGYNALRDLGIVADWVTPDAAHCEDAHIFAPCALGSVINSTTVEELQCAVICGSANNQLEHPHTGYALMQKGITYAPDYIVNAGGITNVFREFGHVDNDFEIAIKLDRIFDRTYECLEFARRNQLPTNLMADRMALKRINQALPMGEMIDVVPVDHEDWTPEDETENPYGDFG